MTQEITPEFKPDKRELTGYNRAVVWVCRSATAVGAVVLSIIMFLSIADISGRALFNKPIDGAWEVVSLSIIVVGVLGLGYTQLVKGNIMIDIFTKRLRPRGQAIMNSVSYLISIGVCVIITWQISLRMWDYMHKKLGGETITLGIPLWPFMALMALGFAWVSVIFILDLWNALKEVFRHGSN